ncbi:hypothetical protein STEG23_024697, partial [Scotinomys teguina]
MQSAARKTYMEPEQCNASRKAQHAKREAVPLLQRDPAIRIHHSYLPLQQLWKFFTWFCWCFWSAPTSDEVSNLG